MTIMQSVFGIDHMIATQ